MIGRPHASPSRFAVVRSDDGIDVELSVEPVGPSQGHTPASLPRRRLVADIDDFEPRDCSDVRGGEVRADTEPVREPQGPSDATLLVNLRAGDAGALDALLDRYWSPVFLYALRLTGSEDAADDVAQDVFCRVWERRATWRAEGSVRGLLFRLARNIAISAHRRERAQGRAMLAFAEGVPMPIVPELSAERAELRLALERAVAQLPARRREVFLLRMLDDLSYDEIAHVMGTSKQTVANQLSRALATLRLALADLLDRAER